MGEDYFAVYCDEIKLADHMTLGTALLFIEAYVQKYWRDNFVMSLHKLSDDRCQINFEVDEKGYEECR